MILTRSDEQRFTWRGNLCYTLLMREQAAETFALYITK